MNTSTIIETGCSDDVIHLHQALELAKQRRGFCAPNPSVGAIIINEKGEVIAAANHLECGASHAEAAALQQLKESPTNATVYVTLEPCCHWGKTPPCTEALIKAGVKRVVYGFKDPNPVVSGKGAQALTAAGITCDYLPTPEIQTFYESYHHWQSTRKPFITAKIAISLNGKISGPNGERIQITGEALQEFTHYSRKHSDAILTTQETITKDNPQLNVRYENEILAKPIYILDSNLKIDLSAKIFQTAKSVTIFHEPQIDLIKKQQLENKNVTCIAISKNTNGLNLSEIIETIGQQGIHDLWIEAGGKLFSAFFTAQLLQRAFIYIAPKWINEGKPAFNTDFTLPAENQQVHWEQMGNDVLCEIKY